MISNVNVIQGCSAMKANASHLEFEAEHHEMRFFFHSQTDTDNRIQSDTVFEVMIDQSKHRGSYCIYNTLCTIFMKDNYNPGV